MNKYSESLNKEQLLTRIEDKLIQVLAPVMYADILNQAMRYSTLNGGKRIRPLLVIAAGYLSGADLEHLLSIGAAIELIHCYSLIHDDLPAMDDDDLRRGRPTCHKEFNEAIAILAGDALQAQAFTLLSDPALAIPGAAKLQIINLISVSAGVSGMVGGQAMDLISTGIKLNLTELKQMHSMKTGALIKAAILSGYLAGPEFSRESFEHLTGVANNLGLLFQITDDILDATGDTATLGKTAHKDLLQDKATYVNILGLDEAQSMASSLYNDSLEMLGHLPQSSALIELTHLVYNRNS